MIEILQPGLQTTVQDQGRDGYLDMAIPPAGAMDQFSYHIANALVGNTPGAAVLEAALLGPEIHAHRDLRIAVTGADVEVLIDGKTRPGWQELKLDSGQVLKLGAMKSGVRAYISFSGGVDVPVVMGSRSTYMPTKLGGHCGRALQKGDELPIGGEEEGGSTKGRILPRTLRPRFEGLVDIRFVPGLCGYRLTDESWTTFTESEYAVSHEANRTGYRFTGPAAKFVERVAPFGAGNNPSNVVSLGYPLGSIQVPNGEEPICLLRDAVTGGGYATIGTVVATDLDVLSQLKKPDRVCFSAVDVDGARELRRDASARLQKAILEVVESAKRAPGVD